MKKVKFILPIGTLLIIISTAFLGLIKDKVPDNIFCLLDIGTYRIPPKSVEVNSSNIYGQSFISNFDNLFMMSIFIPRQDLNREGTLYFHLRRGMDDKDLVTLEWKFSQIRFAQNNFYVIPPDRESTDKGFHFHFQFPPIGNSKKEGFYFYFDSPGANVAEGIKIGVWDDIEHYEALTEGQMFINNKPEKGFLAFRTYDTWKGGGVDLIKKIADRLDKDRQFFIFYCASLFVILISLKMSFVKDEH